MIDTILALINTVAAYAAAYNATHLLPIMFPITCGFVFFVFMPLMMVTITRGEKAEAARKAIEQEERVQSTLGHIDTLYTAIARNKLNNGSASWIALLESDKARALGRLETLAGHERSIQLLKTLCK